jgi:hypothetical protein
MKKTLFLLMLLPFIGLAQTNLVRWNTATPTVDVANITAQNMVLGGGVTATYYDWNNGFRVNELASNGSSALNYSKYIEFRITPNNGYKATLSQYKLVYNSTGDSGPRKIQVRYSTDSSFPSNGIQLGTEQTLTQGSDTALTLSFPSNYVVQQNQTIYIRLYIYGSVSQYYTDFTIRSLTGSNNIQGPTVTGTVSLAGGVNAVGDTATTLQNTPVNINVLSNDTATSTTFGAVTIDTQSTAGTAAVQPDKTITFTPNNNVTGATTFKYKVAGADGTNSTATVNVTVNPFVAPTAVNDTKTTMESTATTIAVLSNDTMGSSTVVASISTTTPAHGTVVVNSTASPVTVTYTPTTGYSGTDTFNYTITDGNGKTATATVTVTITAFTPPTAVNDTKTTIENSATTISVLANDTMGSSTVVSSVTISTLPTHGTAVVNTSASPITVTYTTS